MFSSSEKLVQPRPKPQYHEEAVDSPKNWSLSERAPAGSSLTLPKNGTSRWGTQLKTIGKCCQVLCLSERTSNSCHQESTKKIHSSPSSLVCLCCLSAFHAPVISTEHFNNQDAGTGRIAVKVGGIHVVRSTYRRTVAASASSIAYLPPDEGLAVWW